MYDNLSCTIDVHVRCSKLSKTLIMRAFGQLRYVMTLDFTKVVNLESFCTEYKGVSKSCITFCFVNDLFDSYSSYEVLTFPRLK
jgi:hypothetical protein